MAGRKCQARASSRPWVAAAGGPRLGPFLFLHRNPWREAEAKGGGRREEKGRQKTGKGEADGEPGLSSEERGQWRGEGKGVWGRGWARASGPRLTALTSPAPPVLDSTACVLSPPPCQHPVLSRLRARSQARVQIKITDPKLSPGRHCQTALLPYNWCKINYTSSARLDLVGLLGTCQHHQE